MRITKEMFNSLNKKDKEEYKERIDRLEENRIGTSLGITYIFWLIYLTGFIIIAMPLWKLAFSSEIFVKMSIALFSCIRIMGYAIFIGFTLDIIFLAAYLYKRDKIRSEYFNIKINARRR